MPGFTTHYLFGLNTWKKLDNIPLKQVIQNNHAAYSLGLQGPDLFFYFLPSYLIHENNIGSVAHTEHTGRFLRHLLNSRRLFSGKKEQQIAEAYIAGFLGHYLLDTHCHPYVYWKTRFREKNNRYHGRHMSLETEIDTTLLALYRRCPPSAFRQSRVISLSPYELRTISRILHNVYRQAYPHLGVHRITMHAAIRSIQLGTRFFHDPFGWKKNVVRALEQRILGYSLFSTMIPEKNPSVHTDPLNLRRRPWKNPWDTSLVSDASFPHMMKGAKKRYLETLTALDRLFLKKPFTPAETLEISRLSKRLGNNSYHSGLDAGIPS